MNAPATHEQTAVDPMDHAKALQEQLSLVEALTSDAHVANEKLLAARRKLMVSSEQRSSELRSQLGTAIPWLTMEATDGARDQFLTKLRHRLDQADDPRYPDLPAAVVRKIRDTISTLEEESEHVISCRAEYQHTQAELEEAQLELDRLRETAPEMGDEEFAEQQQRIDSQQAQVDAIKGLISNTESEISSLEQQLGNNDLMDLEAELALASDDESRAKAESLLEEAQSKVYDLAEGLERAKARKGGLERKAAQALADLNEFTVNVNAARLQSLNKVEKQQSLALADLFFDQKSVIRRRLNELNKTRSAINRLTPPGYRAEPAKLDVRFKYLSKEDGFVSDQIQIPEPVMN
ncbi:MAG: hypothetical protein AAGC91_01100 [Pseudomonadota bacterium]